jgi:hypothetical protein
VVDESSVVAPVVSGGGIGGIAVVPVSSVVSPVVVSGGGIGGTTVVAVSSVVGFGIGAVDVGGGIGTAVVASLPDSLPVGGSIGGISVVAPVVVVVVGPGIGDCVVSLVAALVLSFSPQAAAPRVTAITVLRTSAGPGGSGVRPRLFASVMTS